MEASSRASLSHPTQNDMDGKNPENRMIVTDELIVVPRSYIRDKRPPHGSLRSWEAKIYGAKYFNIQCSASVNPFSLPVIIDPRLLARKVLSDSEIYHTVDSQKTF